MPKHYKEMIDEIINKIDEDAPANSVAGGGVDMDQTQFDRLFIRPDLNHILLSDVDRFLDSLAADYPDVVQVSSIGNSWENRPIRLVTLDARSKFILHPKASDQKPVAAAETKKTSDEK